MLLKTTRPFHARVGAFRARAEIVRPELVIMSFPNQTPLSELEVDGADSMPVAIVLNALVVSGLTTLGSLRAHGGGGSVSAAGPSAVRLVSLSQLVNNSGVEGVPADETELHTALAMICFAVYEYGIAHTALPAKAVEPKPELLAAAMYQNAAEAWNYRVQQAYQPPAKIVIGMRSMLLAGTGFSRADIALPKFGDNKALGQNDPTEYALGGGLQFSLKEVNVPVTSVIQALMLLFTFCDALLAAGALACEPPVIKGSFGFIKDPSGTLVRVHVTPHVTHVYLRLALEAAMLGGMTGTRLNEAHLLLHERCSNLMMTGMNYESSMLGVLEVNSFASVLAYAGKSLIDKPTPAPASKTEQQLKDMLKSLKSGQNPKGSPASTGKRSGDKAGLAGQPCGFFQSTRGCHKPGGGACQFPHVCKKCGSGAHGESTCPEP
jgi:hypothetical protein